MPSNPDQPLRRNRSVMAVLMRRPRGRTSPMLTLLQVWWPTLSCSQEEEGKRNSVVAG